MTIMAISISYYLSSAFRHTIKTSLGRPVQPLDFCKASYLVAALLASLGYQSDDLTTIHNSYPITQ